MESLDDKRWIVLVPKVGSKEGKMDHCTITLIGTKIFAKLLNITEVLLCEFSNDFGFFLFK